MVYIGFDVGGTGVQVGVVNEKGEILCKGNMVTRTDIPVADQIKAMADCALDTLNRSGYTLDDVKSLGAGLPGVVDPRTGHIAFCPKNQGLSEEEIDRRVRKAMARVQLDYDKYAERSPFELSGGQMRRVAIAGVLAMEPRYLILDEPAAGLDPKGRDRILGMVKDLHEAGVTVVMVSHSMDDCARLATRMIVMSQGTVVASDTPRKLFAQRELMNSVHLGVPEAAKLCALLREKGIDLPEDLYTQEELHQHILRLWKEVHHA